MQVAVAEAATQYYDPHRPLHLKGRRRMAGTARPVTCRAPFGSSPRDESTPLKATTLIVRATSSDSENAAPACSNTPSGTLVRAISVTDLVPGLLRRRHVQRQSAGDDQRYHGHDLRCRSTAWTSTSFTFDGRKAEKKLNAFPSVRVSRRPPNPRVTAAA